MSGHPLARYGAVLGVCIVAGMVAGVVSGVVTAMSSEGSLLGSAVVAVTSALAMAFGLWASVRWWKGLDEAAQEAHKWAWWWGGTVGLCAAGVVLLTLMFGAGDLGEGSVEGSILAGTAIVIGCEIVGYGVAWVVWWLKRR